MVYTWQKNKHNVSYYHAIKYYGSIKCQLQEETKEQGLAHAEFMFTVKLIHNLIWPSKSLLYVQGIVIGLSAPTASRPYAGFCSTSEWTTSKYETYAVPIQEQV